MFFDHFYISFVLDFDLIYFLKYILICFCSCPFSPPPPSTLPILIALDYKFPFIIPLCFIFFLHFFCSHHSFLHMSLYLTRISDLITNFYTRLCISLSFPITQQWSNSVLFFFIQENNYFSVYSLRCCFLVVLINSPTNSLVVLIHCLAHWVVVLINGFTHCVVVLIKYYSLCTSTEKWFYLLCSNTDV